LPQSVRVIAGEAVGVTGDPVIRKVDLFLTRDLWTQVSAVGGLDTTVRYMEQIETFHGQPDSERTVAAKIAAVREKFIALADSPIDTFSLNAVVNQADDAAKQINGLAQLISQLRNDAENEMTEVVDRINDLLAQIAGQNQEIQTAGNLGRSTATFEDQRDSAVQELAKLIDVNFFTRGDGVMVVQTTSGIQLTDERPNELFFRSSNLGPEKYYPATANGVFVGGDPATNQNAFDMIPYELGGKLGALIDLRDDTLPRYQAQLDETAYRLATRLDSQGLRLFTDQNGFLPADTAPVPNPPGPLTPVPYVGFANVIQVNSTITADPTLLQRGTTGDVIQTGSNEVIRRVIEFGFGAIEYQAIEGARDIRVSVNPLGDTLQENMGLYSQNRLVSSRNLAAFTVDLNVAPGAPFGTPPTNDDFNLRFFDARLAVDTGLVNIDLGTAATNFPIGSPGVGPGIGTVDNAAEQLASYINSLAWPASMNVVATVNIYGQLSIESRGNMQVDGGSMGSDGLDFIGFQAGTYNTTDPYFEIQVGNDQPIRIAIEPGETETDLVAKIDAVPGIDTADIVIDANGFLSFRPHRGGDIRIIGGPFTSVAGFSTLGGNNIIQEIFGNADPVVDYAHAAFRTSLLGPGVRLSTEIASATSIIDYGQKMISVQTQDKIATSALRDDQEQYRATLEKQLIDQSGVNLDEELATMIVIQNAYAAAARAITTANEMFEELLNSFR
jgi:flagellar hook-associated protein 1 FlgK